MPWPVRVARSEFSAYNARPYCYSEGERFAVRSWQWERIQLIVLHIKCVSKARNNWFDRKQREWYLLIGAVGGRDEEQRDTPRFVQYCQTRTLRHKKWKYISAKQNYTVKSRLIEFIIKCSVEARQFRNAWVTLNVAAMVAAVFVCV